MRKSLSSKVFAPLFDAATAAALFSILLSMLPALPVLVLVLGALTAFGPLAIDMYLPSFPAIAAEFGVESARVQLTLAAYFVGMATGQLIYGPLSDRYGRKPPLYAGVCLFVAASVACALAHRIEVLIAFRFVQALGGCAGLVIARAVVRDHFDARESARVLSLLMLVMGVAPMGAPVLGGWLLVAFGWRATFWTLAGFAALCLAAVILFLDESLPPSRRLRHDFGQIAGVYKQLASDRQFIAHALSGSLVFAGMLAYISGSPFVFMQLYGVAPEHYGLYFAINAFGVIAGSQINARLVKHVGIDRILDVAFGAVLVASLLLLTAAATGIGGFTGLLVPLFVCVAAVGFVGPLTTVRSMAPYGAIAGSASALLGTLQFVTAACSGALVGIVMGMWPTHSAVPMALVMAACGAGAMFFHRRAGALPTAAAPSRSSAT